MGTTGFKSCREPFFWNDIFFSALCIRKPHDCEKARKREKNPRNREISGVRSHDIFFGFTIWLAAPKKILPQSIIVPLTRNTSVQTQIFDNNRSCKWRDSEPSERKTLGRLGWNYLFCIQVQFLNNRDKTRVLADTVISGMLHFVKRIVALRMLGELMEILAYFGIDLRVNQERREMFAMSVLIW